MIHPRDLPGGESRTGEKERYTLIVGAGLPTSYDRFNLLLYY
jgi:hypothetical protein